MVIRDPQALTGHSGPHSPDRGHSGPYTPDRGHSGTPVPTVVTQDSQALTGHSGPTVPIMVTQDPTVPTVITQGLTVLTVVTQGPPAPTGHSGPTVLTVGPAWLRAGPQAGLCWERRQRCHRSPRSCLCLSWGVGSVSLLTIRFGFEVSQPQPHTGPLLVHSV